MGIGWGCVWLLPCRWCACHYQPTHSIDSIGRSGAAEPAETLLETTAHRSPPCPDHTQPPKQEGHLNEKGVLEIERDLPRGLKHLIWAAREHGYPHAQHRLAVAHATGLLGPIPRAAGDKVEAVKGKSAVEQEEEEEEEEELGLGDELRSLVMWQFAAAGGDLAAAMALGYRCVSRLSVCLCVCTASDQHTQ
jgi:hypothetical protein